MRPREPEKQASSASGPGPGPGFGRIGVDARDLAGGAGTGIATYAREVLAAIAAHGGAAELFRPAPARIRAPAILRAAWRRLALLPTTARADPDGPTGWAREAADPFRLAQAHARLWGRALACRADDPPALMHWTSPLPIRLRGCPNVHTIHDLIPLRRPNLTDTDPVRYRRRLWAVAAASDLLLAVSDATAAEIARELPSASAKVFILRQAVRVRPPHADPAALARAVRALCGCEPGGYYLHVGSIEPRKNLPALIAAHAACGSSRPLLLAGPDGWRAEQELAPWRARIGHGAAGAPVRRLGYLPRASQLALVQGARALLYPSLAEGFGLPILEAMALGTPVLTARGGATGEVAGASALLVDPRDPAEMAAAVARLDADDALCAALGAGGPARAALFSPGRYADQLIALYRRLVQTGPASVLDPRA